jgi:hypothetical protein
MSTVASDLFNGSLFGSSMSSISIIEEGNELECSDAEDHLCLLDQGLQSSSDVVGERTMILRERELANG